MWESEYQQLQIPIPEPPFGWEPPREEEKPEEDEYTPRVIVIEMA